MAARRMHRILMVAYRDTGLKCEQGTLRILAEHAFEQSYYSVLLRRISPDSSLNHFLHTDSMSPCHNLQQNTCNLLQLKITILLSSMQAEMKPNHKKSPSKLGALVYVPNALDRHILFSSSMLITGTC